MAEKLINVHSPTWLAVKKQAEERMRMHRANLEGNLSRKDTHKARAAIVELKAMLAMGKDEEGPLADPPEELPS